LEQPPEQPETAMVPLDTPPEVPENLNLSAVADLSTDELIAVVTSQHTAGSRFLLEGMRRGLPYFRNAGVALIVLRKRFSKGYWQEWARDKLPFSLRTAQRYIRIADNWDKLVGDDINKVDDMTLKQAIRDLSTANVEQSKKKVERVEEPEPDLLVTNDIKITETKAPKQKRDPDGAYVNRGTVNAMLDQQEAEDEARADMRADPEKMGEVYEIAGRTLGPDTPSKLVTKLVEAYRDQDIEENVYTFFDIARITLHAVNKFESEESLVGQGDTGVAYRYVNLDDDGEPYPVEE